MSLFIQIFITYSYCSLNIKRLIHTNRGLIHIQTLVVWCEKVIKKYWWFNKLMLQFQSSFRPSSIWPICMNFYVFLSIPLILLVVTTLQLKTVIRSENHAYNQVCTVTSTLVRRCISLFIFPYYLSNAPCKLVAKSSQ